MENAAGAEGGMYTILYIIIQLVDKKGDITLEITTKELSEHINLSKQAAINNMTRLVKAGFLIKTVINKGNGHETTYKLAEGKYEFIKYYLYN